MLGVVFRMEGKGTNEEGKQPIFTRKQSADHFLSLKKPYSTLYLELTEAIKMDVVQGTQRELALNLALMKMLEANKAKQPIEEVFPDGIEAYYDALLADFSLVSRMKLHKRWRMAVSRWLKASVGFVVLVGVLFWWTNYLRDTSPISLNDVIKQPANYAYSSEIIPAFEYSMSLREIKSQEGELIYVDQDRGLTMEIGQAEGGKEGAVETKYTLTLASHGNFNKVYALLASPHSYEDPTSNSSMMNFTMQVTYKGKTYHSEGLGFGGMQDGDYVHFNLFPSSAYESGEITYEEEGMATVRISGMTRNIWFQK